MWPDVVVVEIAVVAAVVGMRPDGIGRDVSLSYESPPPPQLVKPLSPWAECAFPLVSEPARACACMCLFVQARVPFMRKIAPWASVYSCGCMIVHVVVVGRELVSVCVNKLIKSSKAGRSCRRVGLMGFARLHCNHANKYPIQSHAPR